MTGLLALTSELSLIIGTLLADGSPVLQRLSLLVTSPLVWAIMVGAIGIWLMLPRSGRVGGAGWWLSVVALVLLLLIMAVNPAMGELGELVLVFAIAACITACLIGVISWITPRDNFVARAIGATLAAAGLVLVVITLPPLVDIGPRILFWALAGMTAISAVATISMKSPIYSALWFALTILITAGLFFMQGAQFLAVATVVVYAGAIIVTFLFLLMLAQPEGHESYDRMSWGRSASAVASVCGVLMAAGLAYAINHLQYETGASSAPAVAATKAKDVLHEEHVAKLGSELFSQHLVSVEIGGTLLLVALVGAIVIVMRSRSEALTNQSRLAVYSNGAKRRGVNLD